MIRDFGTPEQNELANELNDYAMFLITRGKIKDPGPAGLAEVYVELGKHWIKVYDYAVKKTRQQDTEDTAKTQDTE